MKPLKGCVCSLGVLVYRRERMMDCSQEQCRETTRQAATSNYMLLEVRCDFHVVIHFSFLEFKMIKDTCTSSYFCCFFVFNPVRQKLPNSNCMGLVVLYSTTRGDCRLVVLFTCSIYRRPRIHIRSYLPDGRLSHSLYILFG